MAENKKPQSTTKKTTTTRKPRAKKAPPEPPQKTGISRGAWGLIYLSIGILLLISTFSADGVLLKIFFDLCSGLIGYGTYLLIPAMFGLSALFFVVRKAKVRLRATCIFLLPVFAGSLVHAFMVKNTLEFSFSTIISLFTTGVELTSGGVFSGAFAMLLMWAFSYYGAIFILLIMCLVLIAIAFRITPSKVFRKISDLKEYIADEEALEEEIEEELPNLVKDNPKEIEKKPKSTEKLSLFGKKKSANIDIPLDDEKPNKDKTFTETPYDTSMSEDRKVKSADIDADDFDENSPLNDNAEQNDPLAVFADKDNTEHVLQDISKPIVKEISEEDEDFAQQNNNRDAIPLNDLELPVASNEELIQKAATKAIDNEKVVEDDDIVKQMNNALHDPTKSGEVEYNYPPITLLNPHRSTAGDATQELRESSERLLDTLSSFGIDADIINIIRGPSVTRFEIQIPRGVKFSKVTSLSDDIALSLGAANVRIAPIPDKVAVGIELPNKSVQTVFIREVLGSNEFKRAQSKLSFSIGKDITGMPIIGDIAKMPHMLIAGTTGSGKSVCINSLLVSILYKASPEDVRLIMIDPKMIELGSYNGVPHLMIPVVTDPKKASGALNWAVGEMMRRYKLFSELSVRDLASYNAAVKKHNDIPPVEDEEKIYLEKLPQIVIVIDELADLMMVAAREVEDAICRIAQMARAAGMHLVIATQRPSSDVITGIMKANIPSRIAFAVASQIESRIILDQTGAEKLIGKGDMLYSPLGIAKPQRVQGCFLSSEEVEAIVDHIKQDATPSYDQAVLDHIEKQAEKGSDTGGYGDDSGDEDEMLPQAIDLIVNSGQASASMLQRKLKLGYARASRLIDQMEDRGIVGASEGSKPRQVLISREDWQEMKMRQNI